MLELLAGPYAITNGGGAAITPDNQRRAFYDDALGLCLYDATLDGYAIAQLDGTAYLRSAQSRGWLFTLDLQQRGEMLVHYSIAEEELYTFNKHAGTIGELLLSGGTNFVVDLLARATDRWLNVLNSAVRFKPLDNSGSWTTEATLTHAGSGTPTLSLTANHNVVCLIYLDGHIVFYDFVAKVQVNGWANLGANSGAWHSPAHDIFVAIVSNQIKVFANAVRPAALSNPVAVTALTQGRVSRVKVQLLGAQSEACAGELIDWSVTGVGSLAAVQSVTNADGWAYADYLAPVSATGSATINAQAQF